MTSRQGGVSSAPYDSFNLGDHVSDRVVDVETNRHLLSQCLAARPVFLRQVHGTHGVQISADTPDGTEADACRTTQPNLACTVMVADCLPLLFTDVHGLQVAAVHAGWRGLCGSGQSDGQGILERFVKEFCASPLDDIQSSATEFKSDGSTDPEQVLAWLGPCIGPDAFEVGSDVRDAFLGANPQDEPCFRQVPGSTGKFLADLAGLARRRLERLGVVRVFGNNSGPEWCTVSQMSTWFSHRRDAVRLGSTGRMAACIWRV